jgi:O-antigen biosynthesis protein
MTVIPASLIIVSRHRPAALMRALAGVAQMDHPAFEVIVVADPAAASAVHKLGLPLKIAVCDHANISAARNIGLKMAAAPVVAFMDDDAVPEPSWLSRLVAPFANPQVTAAGGYVLGRSGLAWQWRAMWVDGNGFDHPFAAPATVSLHAGSASRTIKTQGTNCAFRRSPLLAIGGFDEAFAFYLDEADVNLRLAAQGGLTAIVPDAVMHHGFAASSRRRSDRTPTDLSQIGNSLAVFTTRHSRDETALAKHIAHQRARLIRLMVAGALEPADVRRLLASLYAGIDKARLTKTAPLTAPLAPDKLPFVSLAETGPRAGKVFCGPMAQRKTLEAQARAAQAKGEIVTLILLSRGFRPHKHRFTAEGWWEQSGGRFGRAFRNGDKITLAPIAERLKTESDRLALFRPIGEKGPKKSP